MLYSAAIQINFESIQISFKSIQIIFKSIQLNFKSIQKFLDAEIQDVSTKIQVSL